MSESVNLMQLQDIDLQLLKLASNLASMPQVQKIKNAQLAEKKIASQLKQVLGVKKDVEIDISDLNEQRAHYVLKTDEVSAAVETATNHRALRDFDQQLSSLAISRSAILNLQQKQKSLRSARRLIRQLKTCR